jgi:hypothetical protein
MKEKLLRINPITTTRKLPQKISSDFSRRGTEEAVVVVVLLLQSARLQVSLVTIFLWQKHLQIRMELVT